MPFNLSQLLPSICPFCHILHYDIVPICKACKKLLPTLRAACKYCAMPLINNSPEICGSCSQKPPIFDKIYTKYLFESHLRKILHDFKYNQGLYWLKFLSELIMEAVPYEARINTLLIPVPIHKDKLKQRGYNQSAELTKYIGKKYKIPYDLFLCNKIINSESQTALNALERRKNIRNSFELSSKLNNKNITIIDDLVTTGSTVTELSKLLKLKGALKVNIWCSARAIL